MRKILSSYVQRFVSYRGSGETKKNIKHFVIVMMLKTILSWLPKRVNIFCCNCSNSKLEGARESAYLRQVKWFKHCYCKMWKFSQKSTIVLADCVWLVAMMMSHHVHTYRRIERPIP